MKIGLDLHHVIDHDPKFFSKLSAAIIAAGGEIHILTGSEISEKIISELKNYGMVWTKLFSIADYYKAQPGVKMWRDKEGRPWVSDLEWNCAKGLYAEQEGLDIVLDDTPIYGEYMKDTSYAICKVVNKSGIEHRPKAKMPPPPPDDNEAITEVNNSDTDNERPITELK